MSEITCRQSPTLTRSEVRACAVDLGENTSGEETGVLKAGATASSGTIAVQSKPSGAADLTLSSVSINGSSIVVAGRTCSAGEAATFTVTTASDQALGMYVLLLTISTSSSETIKRRLPLYVGVE